MNSDQVIISNRKKKKNCFEVQTPSRTYYLVADSEGERDKWIEIIRQSTSGGRDSSSNSNQARRIGVQDFDLLNVIGKGSFGKVFLKLLNNILRFSKFEKKIREKFMP